MPEFIAEHVPSDLDAFTRAYLECAEWLLPEDEELDLSTIRGFSTEAIERAKADCRDFQEANADLLARYEEVTGRDMAHAGHDFWLTRNRHGTGFWDRGTHGCLEELTDISNAYGEVEPYVGDDRLIYFF